MPGFVANIRNILEPSLIQQGTIRLSESAPSSQTPAITLRQNSVADVLVLHPDSADRFCDCGSQRALNRHLFPWRQAAPGVTVICDYLIFYQERQPDSRLFVFLCELKSHSANGAASQVVNGSIVADALVSAAAYCNKVAMPIVEKRGIVFRIGASTPGGDPRRVGLPYRPLPRWPTVSMVHYPPRDVSLDVLSL